LQNETATPIVFAGLVDSPGRTYPPGVTGLKSFDPNELCPFWPALLAALPFNVKKVAVIYDQNASRTGMLYQDQVIEANWNAFGFEPLTPTTRIHADDPANQSPTNPNIASDIATFLQGVGNNPAGLIVTAGTRTTMLRDDIIAAVTARNLSANKLFAIYPCSIFKDTRALMAYGPDLRKIYKDVATTYVRPIITGHAPPAIATNHHYELIVSQSAANAVNFTIPSQFVFNLANGQTQTITPKIVH
jgi:hypothetical protein